MILNREFTKREKALLVLFILLLIGFLYYFIVYRQLEDARVRYNLDNLQTEYEAYRQKTIHMDLMNEEISKGKAESNSIVESYNNLKNEIRELNDIFADAPSFSFSFAQAQAKDDAVRRSISANFTANSYQDARRMLQNLYDCRYRCLIRNITIDGDKNSDLHTGMVTCSFNVTFYETMYNAWTTDGLATEKGKKAAKTENIASELVKRREEVENMS